MKRGFEQREVVKRAVTHLLVDRLTSSQFFILVGRLTVESWFQDGSLIVVVSGSYIRGREMRELLIKFIYMSFPCRDSYDSCNSS